MYGCDVKYLGVFLPPRTKADLRADVANDDDGSGT